MAFFDKLKLAIAKRNTTFTEVEKNVGFGRGTIGKWKKSSPSYENIIKVINYLKVDLYWLMEDELDFNFSNSYKFIDNTNKENNSILNKEYTENINIYEDVSNLNEEDKQLINLIIKSFSNKSSVKLTDKEKYFLSIYNKLSTEDKIKIEGIIENRLSFF